MLYPLSYEGGGSKTRARAASVSTRELDTKIV